MKKSILLAVFAITIIFAPTTFAQTTPAPKKQDAKVVKKVETKHKVVTTKKHYHRKVKKPAQS